MLLLQVRALSIRLLGLAFGTELHFFVEDHVAARVDALVFLGFVFFVGGFATGGGGGYFGHAVHGFFVGALRDFRR